MPAESQLLIPILVDAAGRSGTTAVMQLLASSPAVVTERAYPYESRYLTYLYSWSRLLDGDPKAAGKWERGAMLPGPPDNVGGLPWRDLLRDQSEFAGACFQSAWKHFSAAAPEGGTHYIEKVPRWIAEQIPTQLPATRVIHLVRDPRDIWLSIAAFNDKRGFDAFGRREGQSDAAFLEEFIESQRLRLEPLAGVDLGEGATLLRYEDLVADPEAVADRLGSWLGLDFDAAAFGRREERHATSGSAQASAGRWRGELDEGFQRRFESGLGALLQAFGYS